MKILLLLSLLITHLHIDDMTSIRQLYAEAAMDEKKAMLLIEKTKNEKYTALVIGYNGAGKILMAKHYLNPVSKWNSFRNGKDLLESAIHSDPGNPELRYLRLSIQQNLPSFLNYAENIERDKAFLQKSLPTIDDDQLQSIIRNYLKKY